jgi:hypothetical protein
VCGIRFRNNQLVRGPDGKFRCIRWCAEQTQLERDRISADSNKRREAPPPPFGVPYSFKDSYSQEAEIFNFLTNLPVYDSGWTGGFRLGAAPGATFLVNNTQQTPGAYSMNSAGETVRYLYELVVEKKKPSYWISRATKKIIELADWIYSKQVGFGTSTASTKSNDANYGAVFIGAANQVAVRDQAYGGLAMLRAFQLTGTDRYLASARGFADCLSSTQRDDLRTTGFSSSADNSSNRAEFDTWTNTFLTVGTGLQFYFPNIAMQCIEFLNELFKQVGDEIHGADTTVSGFYISAPQRLLSSSISKARAFWSVGAYDNRINQVITGFSSTTPYEQFIPYLGNQSNPTFGRWSDSSLNSPGTTITAANFSNALRCLYAFEGYSAQVSSIWTWLMSFTSNPAFQSTTKSIGQDAPTVNGVNGNYNPKIALTSTLAVRDANANPVALNGSSAYALVSAGYMSRIQASQSNADLDAAKDYIVSPGLAVPEDYDYNRFQKSDWRILYGVSNLNGFVQQSTGVPNLAGLLISPGTAAAIGQMFRANANDNFQI